MFLIDHETEFLVFNDDGVGVVDNLDLIVFRDFHRVLLPDIQLELFVRHLGAVGQEFVSFLDPEREVDEILLIGVHRHERLGFKRVGHRNCHRLRLPWLTAQADGAFSEFLFVG